MASDMKKLVIAAFHDAISADADWSQRHIEQRDADLERIADELIERLTPAVGAAGEPVAWYVERVAPGMLDNGVRTVPTFNEREADRWVDENHQKRALYAHPSAGAVEYKDVRVIEFANGDSAHFPDNGHVIVLTTRPTSEGREDA